MQNQTGDKSGVCRSWSRLKRGKAIESETDDVGAPGIPGRLGAGLLNGATGALSGILIALLAFNLYFPLASRLTGNPYPSLFGLRQAVVLSNSMAPALMAGDLIVIHEAPVYRSGDILTYVDSHVLVTHRLLAANAANLTLQGDANQSPDRPVHPAQVLGKTVLRLPAAGMLSQWLRALR